MTSPQKPSRRKENRRRSIRKITVSPQTKPQFSGSCVNKSRQLRPKNRITGTGWKRVRKHRVTCQSASKGSVHKKGSSSRKNSSKKPDPKPHLVAQVLSHKSSWKSRKKKLVHFKGPALNETASWKRRKKKATLVARLEFSYIRNGPSPRKVRSWKRKKKSRCSRKWLYSIYEWDPGIAFSAEVHGFKLLFRRGVCERVDSREINGKTSSFYIDISTV